MVVFLTEPELKVSPRLSLLFASRQSTLLGQIERDLLADKPLPFLLRRLVMLGGQIGSRDLAEWASKELRGYDSEDELPSYRRVPAPILMDAVTSYATVTGQRVGVSELPKFAREHIDEQVSLMMGVSEIEAMSLARGIGDVSVNLSLPGARELARFMQQGTRSHINGLYWSVSRVAMAGVVDQVRTRLAELIAELRFATPTSQPQPNAEQAQHAVNVVLRGFKPHLTMNSISAGDGSRNQIDLSGGVTATDTHTPFWTIGRKIGSIVVGLAAVAGAIFTAMQVF